VSVLHRLRNTTRVDRSDASEGARQLLQERLLRSMAIMGGIGLIVVPIVTLSGVTGHAPGAAQDYALALGIALILSGAALLKLVDLPLRTLNVFDVLIHVAVAFSLAGLSWVGPSAQQGRFGGLIIAVIGVFWRATLVPSHPRRTAFVSLAMFLPIVIPAWIPLSFLNQAPVIRPSLERAMFVIWPAITTFLAMSVSRTLYDLRRDVSRARRLGRYELSGLLGSGGMGEVHLAHHQMLRRPTAVKLLRPDRAGEVAIRRFEREVQLTASLSHPNTIHVFDYGRTVDRVFYYAMELLDGFDLDEVVARSGPMHPRRVVHVLGQVASSLAEAHDNGLIHRDVKAANVMLCRYGGMLDWVKVLDFGLARQADGPEVAGTAPGTISGTPAYLAPEGWHGGEHVDARSDLYALGVLAWFLLRGELPFGDHGNLVTLLLRHQEEVPESPTGGPGTVRALNELVASLLAKSPDERPPTARAVATRLEEIARDLGPWTQLDAAAWWDLYGRDEPATPIADSLQSTLDIDAAELAESTP